MKVAGFRALVASGMALFFAGGCGAPETAAEDSPEDVATLEQALAPAGSNAEVVGSTIPSSLYPGERRVVSVTMRNTGAASPSNDWTTSNPAYGLQSASAATNWGYAYVSSTVPVGAAHTFTFVLTAPASSQPVQARMNAVGRGIFGATLSVPARTPSSAT